MHKTKKCFTCGEIKEEKLFWKTGYMGGKRKSCGVCTKKAQRKYVASREKKYKITEKWPFPNGWWIDEYGKSFNKLSSAKKDH